MREVFWIFLGLLPFNLLILYFLYHFLFLYEGNEPLSSIFSTFEIQQHDYYIVLDPIVAYSGIVLVSFAFVYSIRMFLSKFGALPLNIIALIMLLGADYYLFRAYTGLIELAGVAPMAYHDYAFIEYLFKGTILLTLVAITAIGVLLYRNHRKSEGKPKV